MHHVYLLKLSNNKIYTGSTDNIENRIKDHNQGKCDSTKDHRPIKLIWFCTFQDKSKAEKFESYLKTVQDKRLEIKD